MAPGGCPDYKSCMSLSGNRSHKHQISPLCLCFFSASDQDCLLAKAQAQTSSCTHMADRPFTLACSLPSSPLHIHHSPQPMNCSTSLFYLPTLYLLTIMTLVPGSAWLNPGPTSHMALCRAVADTSESKQHMKWVSLEDGICTIYANVTLCHGNFRTQEFVFH